MTAKNEDKLYVDIVIRQSKEGLTRPLFFLYAGERYEVDKVKHVCRAASLKYGGSGMRYTVMIAGRQYYLFDEGGRWFVSE